jgi:hypothetical protein
VITEKSAAVAAYAGGGTAVAFGLTSGEWQAIGVIVGIFIGVAGLALNAYFQWRRLKLDEGRK